MKFLLLLFLLCLSYLSTTAQTKFISKGISFVLPDEFKTADTGGSEFAAFKRSDNLQLGFSDGIHTASEKYYLEMGKSGPEFTFNLIFSKCKSQYYPVTDVVNPKDTTIHKLSCRWGQFQAKIKDHDYYFVLVLVQGKKYNYDILYTGRVENKDADLKLLNGILASYKEEKKTN